MALPTIAPATSRQLRRIRLNFVFVTVIWIGFTILTISMNDGIPAVGTYIGAVLTIVSIAGVVLPHRELVRRSIEDPLGD
jgi:hypothetical protein